MTPGLSLLCWLALAQPDPIETKLLQVHPAPKDAAVFERSKGQDRAILLLHGFNNPLSAAKTDQAHLHEWQKPGSILVKALSKEADVFAFTYGQTAPLSDIAKNPALGNGVKKLDFLGYKEIIVVGHSAGGVLARMLVEDQPMLPVKRVVQVCAPNAGSSWATRLLRAVPKDQEPFVTSLTRPERQKSLEHRADKKIPAKIEFVCVVGRTAAVGDIRGDSVVSCISQWSEDLQKQNIPAVCLTTSHFTVMRSKTTAERIAEVVYSAQPRWSEEKTREQCRAILGK